MRTFCHCCLWAGKVGGAFAVVLGGYLVIVNGLSLSPWDLGQLSAQLGTEHQRDEELTALLQRVDVRLAGKNAVADVVREGRLDLLEAAARFRDLNDADPSFEWDVFRQQTPGATDAERLCRSVIDFVANPPDLPPHQAELVRQLEAELAARRGDGSLRLREPRPPVTAWSSDRGTGDPFPPGRGTAPSLPQGVSPGPLPASAASQ
jgi:hypothetical protein